MVDYLEAPADAAAKPQSPFARELKALTEKRFSYCDIATALSDPALRLRGSLRRAILERFEPPRA